MKVAKGQAKADQRKLKVAEAWIKALKVAKHQPN